MKFLYGTKYSDESGKHFMLIPNDGQDDASILNLFEEKCDTIADGWRCHTHDGDCCGRMFGRKAYIRRSSTRVLVTQYMGLDI